MGSVTPVPIGKPTFIGAQRWEDLDTIDADVAVIGVPYGYPYDMAGSTQRSSHATATVREQSMRFTFGLMHYDYDFGGDIFAGRDVKIVDLGDVTMSPGQYAENSRATTEVIGKILDRGAVPIVLGGDHAIPIPVMRAYEGREPMVVVQLDAHLDWREEINGVREGLSSPMRRASEMSCVAGMAQIGLRGVGSGRQQEFDDARAYGSVLIGAQELHEIGVDAVLERIPASERYYITFDADGLDPAIAPGVGAPGFGGITYFESLSLIRGIANKGRIVGFDFNEIVPALDVKDMTSLLGARIALNVIGTLAYAGQIGTSK
jgi:agmatinase